MHTSIISVADIVACLPTACMISTKHRHTPGPRRCLSMLHCCSAIDAIYNARGFQGSMTMSLPAECDLSCLAAEVITHHHMCDQDCHVMHCLNDRSQCSTPMTTAALICSRGNQAHLAAHGHGMHGSMLHCILSMTSRLFQSVCRGIQGVPHLHLCKRASCQLEFVTGCRSYEPWYLFWGP